MKLLLDFWSAFCHSYAIVAVNHLVWLLRSERFEKIFIKESPPYNPNWKRIDLEGITLNATEKKLIRTRALPYNGEQVDIIYRIAFPHNIEPAKERLFVFFTSEFQTLEKTNFAGTADFNKFKQLLCENKINAITPSKWSRAAVPFPNVHVVSHGVDPNKFFPDRKAAVSLRKILHIPEKAIVFINVSAMTGNKRVGLSLKALYLCNKRNDKMEYHMILKGLSSLYNSNFMLQAQLQALMKEPGMSEIGAVLNDKIHFLDGTLGYRQLNNLYNAADCYLTPYAAEGFNMPALEAEAAGLPIIASSNGPTDEFIHVDCLFPILTKKITSNGKSILMVDEEDLVNQMTSVAENKDAILERTQQIGPEFVRKNFSWQKQTENLIDVLLDGKL